MKQLTLTNFSKPKKKPTTSSKMPKKKGNFFLSWTCLKFSSYYINELLISDKENLKKPEKLLIWKSVNTDNTKKLNSKEWKKEYNSNLFDRNKINNLKLHLKAKPNKKSTKLKKISKETKIKLLKCSSIKF